MASLSGNKIKDTYQSLIKLTDNGNLTTGAKQLTDGFGNNSPLYISTTQIGIGVTPEATYDLHVYQNAKVGGNLTITGDLTVNGTTTTVDTDTLRVEDPLIEVARNNTSSDAVDIGIYGKYAPSGTTLYAGLFRDTGDDKFKLFKSLQEQPTTTVNTSGTGYAKAGLVIGDLESTAGIFSGDVSIPQTNKIRFDGSSGHTYISETADSNLKFFVAGIEQINVSNNLLDINSPIAMNSNNISGGGTFTATTFSGQLDGTISSTTTATTQSTGDNSTKVATTAYVDASIGNSTLAEVLVNGDTTGGGNIVFGDSDSFLADDTLMFGASNDLVIYHDGSNSFIREKGTGNLYIDSDVSINLRSYTGAENMLVATKDGAVDLYYDASKKLETTSTGVTVTGAVSATTFSGQLDGTISSATTAVTQSDGDNSTKVATTAYVDTAIQGHDTLAEILTVGNTTGGTDIAVSANDSITFTDSSKAKFGASSDLEIYHSGSHTFIENDTGYLMIRSDTAIYLRSATGNEQYIVCSKDGPVELYYNDVKKFETTNTGINVTGGIAGDDSVFIEGNTNPNFTAHDITNETYTSLWSGDTEGKLTFNHNNFRITYAAYNFTGTDLVTITNGGLVGIGTTSPNTILEIASGNSDGDAALDAPVFRINNTTESSDWDTGDVVGSIEYYTSDTSGNAPYVTSFIKSVNETGNGTLPDGALTFGTATYNASGGAVERMRIDSSGNITAAGTLNIGTHGAYAIKLQSSDGTYEPFAATSGNHLYFYNNDDVGNYFFRNAADSSTLLTITDGGNVGIGTTSPLYKLDVDSTAAGDWITRIKNQSSTGYGLYVQSSNNAAQYLLGLHNGDAYQFIVNGAGNVGIGTTSPNYTLDVSGEINATTRYRKNGYEIVGQNSTELRLANASYWQTLALYTNGTPRLIIDSSGNVGINETNPTNKLHTVAASAITDTSILRLSGGETGFSGSNDANIEHSIIFDACAYSASSGIVQRDAAKIAIEKEGSWNQSDTGGGTDASLVFSTNNGTIASPNLAERMRIDSSGNVNIGTTAAATGSHKLVVESASTTGTVNSHIALIGDSATNGQGPQILFSESGDGQAYAGGTIGFARTGGNSQGDLLFGTRGSSGDATTTTTERMRIDSSGNLSLATATSLDFNVADFAQIKFKESGAITIDSDNNQSSRNFQFKDGDGSSLMFIGDDGNVGIGTTSPRNDANFVTLQVGSTATAASQIVLDDNDSNGPWRIISNQSLIINDDATERMRIDSSGNVCINNTSVTGYNENFNVTGQGIVTENTNGGNRGIFGFFGGTPLLIGTGDGVDVVFRTDNTERMRINSSGNVGIGTTNPQNKFVVANGTDNTQNIEIAPNYIQSFNRQSGNLGYASMGFYASSYTFNTGKVSVGVCSGTLKEFNIKNQGSNGGLRIEHSGSSNTVAYIGQGGSGDEGVIFLQDSGVDTVKIAGENGVNSFINSGQVGIGTDSPNQQLDVSGNIAVRGGYKIYFNSEVNLNRYIGASSSNDLDIAADDDINYRSNFNRFFDGSTEFARLSGSGVSWLGGGSNGYVGIGTTSPTVPLAIHGQQKWYTTNVDGNELRGFFNPGGSADDGEFSVYKADGATEGVVLRGAGNTYIRIDSTSLKFINFYYGTSNVGQIVTGGTNVLYQSNSDYRLKENVVEMTGALDRVSQLKPSTYNFISQPETQVDGFMAHELQEVVPQAVSGEKDEMNEDGTPKYQGVDHSQIVPLLVGAIKELKAEIETLKTQINK